jgi:hypothetical protein
MVVLFFYCTRRGQHVEAEGSALRMLSAPGSQRQALRTIKKAAYSLPGNVIKQLTPGKGRRLEDEVCTQKKLARGPILYLRINDDGERGAISIPCGNIY